MNAKTIGRQTALMGAAVLFATNAVMAQQRQWQDMSGLYRVTASLVTYDDNLVVLRKSDGELVALNRAELSVDDGDFLAIQDDSKSSNQDADRAPVDAQADKIEAGVAQSPRGDVSTVNIPDTSEDVAKRKAAKLTRWRLRNGEELEGKLTGFGSQVFHLKRQGGVIRVNDVSIKDLPSAYQLILPPLVSKIDRMPIADLKELEKHLAAGGGGPFAYEVNGIQLDLQQGGVFTVPLEFLEPAEAALVAPGFARWLAARVESVSVQDRYETDARERLMLDSYSRLRGLENVDDRALKMVELGLLSVNAGVTELWEVGLLPNTPYGFPRSLIVPGRTSLAAQEIAMQRFPGWQVGYARKVSD
ncbi:MAG: SHD1 domain-containing protein [Aureliella sp.]